MLRSLPLIAAHRQRIRRIVQDVSAEQAGRLAENIETALRQPLDIPGGGSVRCIPSTGFAVYPSQGTDFEELVQAARCGTAGGAW